MPTVTPPPRPSVGHDAPISPEHDDAIERLWRAHAGAVWAYAARRVGRDRADDVVSQVFLVAWRHRSELHAHPRPWLYGVARNVLNDQRRSGARLERLTLRLRHEQDGRHDGSTAPDGGLDALTALNALRPEDQDLLICMAWDGMSVAELAVYLDVSRAAARVRIHRARGRLERELGTGTHGRRETER